MKSQHDGATVELCFDLIFNIIGSDRHAAEVAGESRSLATPHAKGNGPPQGGHVQPSRSGLGNP